MDSEVGQRGKCVNCQAPFTFTPARPIWVLVAIPTVLVVIAVAAVLIVNSYSNTVTITETTETGQTVKTVLHVDHSEYEAKTRKLFGMFQRMSSEADDKSSAIKKMSVQEFAGKFGDLADFTREFDVTRKFLSDDEKKLGSWLYATSAFNHFQASSQAKVKVEASGETQENNSNVVAWNLRAAAGCWKVADGFMKVGDELLVPLDCPLCAGEKLVECGSCGGLKTVIDAQLGHSVPCKTCNATGKVTCPVCNGEGKILH
jgi:hypothetical protein